MVCSDSGANSYGKHPRQPGSQYTVAPCAETLAGEDDERGSPTVVIWISRTNFVRPIAQCVTGCRRSTENAKYVRDCVNWFIALQGKSWHRNWPTAGAISLV